MGGGRYDANVQYKSTWPVQVIQFFSGGIAGSVAKTASAPLDRAKILFQTRHPSYVGKGLVGMLQQIIKTEGFWKLWRGNSATLARVFPYAAVQFMAYERYKSFIVPQNNEANTIYFLISGSLAGATAVAITYPLDLVRARMASQVTVEQYKNIFHAVIKMYKSEGFKSLYRGMVPTMQGILPYAGINFGAYETLKFYAPKDPETQRVGTVSNLIIGGMAGATGQTISYPWDVVRRRKQTWGFAEGTKYVEGKGSFNIMYNIIKKEGLRALFRGISINYIKVSPTVGISFTVYELVQVHIFGKTY